MTRCLKNLFPIFCGLRVPLIAAAAFAIPAALPAADAQFLTYFGTYNNAKSKGIYVSRLDPATGRLSAPELAAEAQRASFLAVHPNRRWLYAVGELQELGGKKSGAVNAFTINPASGQLTLLNQQSSGGPGPAHLSVDQTGRCVLVANYAGGSVATLPIQADGKLGEVSSFIQHTGSSVNPQRQNEPHAHSINVSSDNRFAFVADLGLDRVFVYRLDADTGKLSPNDPPFTNVAPGSGPRHFAFHPSGRYAYVINEMACTMTAFAYDAKRGALKEVQTLSTLPAEETVKPNYSTAEVQVHPGGKFLYGSNRGHNTIVVFALDETTGKLTRVENVPTQGRTPRNFGIDPGGRFLLAANQGSDTVAVFRIDARSGRLTPTGQIVEVGAPVCVKFVP